RSVITNEKGEFVFVGIRPGFYDVIAELAGFTTTRVVAEVSADHISTLVLTMRIGGLEERVTVTGQTPRVEVQAALSSAPPSSAISAGAAGGVVRGIAIPGGFNTEAYDRIDDNQWTQTTRKPLSTFSI